MSRRVTGEIKTSTPALVVTMRCLPDESTDKKDELKKPHTQKYYGGTIKNKEKILKLPERQKFT